MAYNETLSKIQITATTGLVDCNNLTEGLHISELLHVQSTAKKLNADFVFFRRIYNKEEEQIDSKPVLYLFSKDEDFINSKQHIDLQAKIWSASEVDVYFIINTTNIHIFNARRSAQANKKDELNICDLCLISEAVEQFNDQRFSAYLFTTGTFWEQDIFSNKKEVSFFKNRLDEKNAPYHRLLEYLKETKKQIIDKKRLNLEKQIIDKLLIICILVKFLEDIQDEDGRSSIKNIYKKHKIESFSDALRTQGKCIAVLDDLATEFNGKIFDNFSSNKDPVQQEIENSQIKKQLSITNLAVIADFLAGNIDIKKGQLFLWKQYDFNFLPVELISSIYEYFLDEKSAVYTPPFLVNFLVDEAMPIAKAAVYFSDCQYKVLDPSCGSGIFLVAAYKRMLQWWVINNSSPLQIKTPDKKVCQKILEDNIFGVDVNDTATLISIFSLTIALLDKLDPKEIWNNLKFKNLRERNIQTQNFFDWAAENKEKHHFDLVIGNPPFNPEADKKVDKVIEKFPLLNPKHTKIPDKNLALHFFEGAMTLSNRACLIIPSNVLLYSTRSQVYREEVFSNFTVDKIYDFTHLRRILFHAEVPTVAILASSNPTETQKNIGHIVVKRIVVGEQKIQFEIDHYDYHQVPVSWACDASKQFVWKTNLLGGGQLFHFIYRLSLLPTLKDFIDKKKKEDDEWMYGVGYIVGNKKKVAPYLFHKPTLKGFNETENIFLTSLEENNMFEAPRPEILYKAPLVVISLGKKNNPAQLFSKNQIFNSKFLGIRSPQKDVHILDRIYQSFFNESNTYKLFQTYMFSISSQAMINKETVFIKEDFDNLPFPEDESLLNPSPTEKILQEDVLNYYIHLGKAISEKGEGKKLYEKVQEGQLMEYGQVYCDMLNPIYEQKEKQKWQIGSVYQTDNFTVFQFIYGKPQKQGSNFQSGDLNKLAEIYSTLYNIIFNTEENRAAIFTRVARIYDHINGYDSVIFIKPNALRYWLRSIALRDADETFQDLKSEGY